MKNWILAILIVLISTGIIFGIGFAVAALGIGPIALIVLMFALVVFFFGFIVYMVRNYLEDRGI